MARSSAIGATCAAICEIDGAMCVTIEEIDAMRVTTDGEPQTHLQTGLA
jgi:hypothetical protein